MTLYHSLFGYKGRVKMWTVNHTNLECVGEPDIKLLKYYMKRGVPLTYLNHKHRPKPTPNKHERLYCQICGRRVKLVKRKYVRKEFEKN